ncbi:hypothetical protein NBRC116598_40750 [Pseudophaeobacter arcticus]|uniref:Tn3 transposase DDE domain-containing protein n=1 Tax=Pseudophaeobacter arcticus TaxID=385492 RepID=A0ABQ0AS01_9RHOB
MDADYPNTGGNLACRSTHQNFNLPQLHDNLFGLRSLRRHLWSSAFLIIGADHFFGGGSIGRQGEIRDRSSRAQDDRLAGLNFLAAIIIYWNIKQLGQIIAKRRRAGIYDSEDLLSHVSPLGWVHILITGEYRWHKKLPENPLAQDSAPIRN